MVIKQSSKKEKGYILTIVLLLIVIISIWLTGRENKIGNEVKQPETVDLNREILNAFSLTGDGDFLLIDKGTKTLQVYDDYNQVSKFYITIGKEPGNKLKPGDNRTPEGIFTVKSIEPSSHWFYDFKDDSIGSIEGAFGPWFIRIEVPGFRGIGIHGFIDDTTLGTRNSHGCIRLNNDELLELVKLVKPGIPVVILPDKHDRMVNNESIVDCSTL